MNEVILNGVFTLLGAALGGFIAYFTNRKKEKEDSMKNAIVKLAKQVVAYWNLEKEYSKALAEGQGRAEQTICKEFRNIVNEKVDVYPEMTAKQAKAYIDKYEQ